MSQEFREGQEARWRGVPRNGNPYAKNPFSSFIQVDDWDQGWDEAHAAELLNYFSVVLK